MPIDFPSAPTVGQVFTVGNKSWTWSGSLWTAAAVSVYETIVNLSFVSNVLTFSAVAGQVAYVATAPTASWTVNFTNVDTTNDRALSMSILVTQGATGFGPTTLQIAGAAQTIKWQGGSAPTPTSGAGKIDVYSFTLLRQSSAWTVLGTASVNF